MSVLPLPAGVGPGSYGVVRTSGFVAWVIRKLTRSRYDHAFIVTGLDGTIIEAEPSGARVAQITEYDGYEILFDSGDGLTDQQRAAIVAAARLQVGTPYGFLDIARLGLQLTLRRSPSWLTRRADTERAMICSQLVAACGLAAGVDWLCGQQRPAQVTPGMLAERITAMAVAA